METIIERDKQSGLHGGRFEFGHAKYQHTLQAEYESTATAMFAIGQRRSSVTTRSQTMCLFSNCSKFIRRNFYSIEFGDAIFRNALLFQDLQPQSTERERERDL